MINDQEYITTELKKTLEKMIPLSSKRLSNSFLGILSRIVGFAIL